MKIGRVIQARLGSTRLPNKVMQPIDNEGTLIIEEIINRSRKVNSSNVIIVATSDKPKDDFLANYILKKSELCVVRGSEEDVLRRFVLAAKKYSLDCVVRLTGDNPFIDPIIIDKSIDYHLSNQSDYTYTTGYPLGMNVEVVSTSALVITESKATSISDREHVTQFIRNNPEVFSTYTLDYNGLKDLSNLRLTVDTPEDYLSARILFDFLNNPKSFGLKEVIQLYDLHPLLFEINKNVYQKKQYDNIQSELKDAIDLLSKNNFSRVVKSLTTNIDL